MSDSTLEAIPQTLRNALERDRLASAYLLYGRPPLNFVKPVKTLLKTIVCTKTDTPLEACGSCRDCRQADELTHPDITAPGAPGDTGDKGVNDRFGVQDVRDLIIEPSSLTPARSSHKLFWLHDLTRFTTEASNSLLKVLEEPPGDALFLLTTRSRWDCLPTIRSRCQWIRIPPESRSQRSFVEQCQEQLTEEPNEEEIGRWIDLLNGQSRSHEFNWTRTSASQFLEFLLLLVRDQYTERLLDETDYSRPEERLSYRLIPDILQRLDELDRGGNPPLVINSLLEDIFYPEESDEWVNVM
jgi:DNA polymerase III delta prime subunit